MFAKGSRVSLIEKNVFVLSFTAFIITAAKFTWYPILPIYLIDLGANDFQVAFTYTLLTFSSAFMQFLGGTLSDIFGRRNLIVIPTFIFPICYILSAHSSYWLTLIIFLIAADSLSAIQLPSFYALIAESTQKTKRGLAYGFYHLFMVLGRSIGPTVGMILVSRMNIKSIFYLVALINIICALGRAVFLKETHKMRLKTGNYNFWKYFLNKNVWYIILIFSPLFMLNNLTIKGPFISLYAHEVLRLEKSKINLFFALGSFAAVTYSLLGGKIIDKIGNKKVLAFSVFGLGFFIFLWSYSPNFILIIILFSITYIFYQSCQIAYDSFVADITQEQSRGQFIGFIGTCNGVIGSLAPFVGGYLKNQFGMKTPFLAALLCALFSFLLLSFKKLE